MRAGVESLVTGHCVPKAFKRIAEVTSRGGLVAHALPEYGLLFNELAEKFK